MNYLIAVDSFKGSLSSLAAGEAISRGIRMGQTDAKTIVVPMADGGEGTIDVLKHCLNVDEFNVKVHGPRMDHVIASYVAFSFKGIPHAFIECAQSTGLMLVTPDQRNPMVANSYGLGEQIKDAIMRGYRHIILSLGGSATNDGGCGMLQALGWKFYDKEGKLVTNKENPLLSVFSMSEEDVIPEIHECSFLVASDVDNPFYGENGAAKIFAKQKGANIENMNLLDKAMRRFASLIKKHKALDVQLIGGSGAAGGLGGTIVSFLNGEIQSGSELLMEITDMERLVSETDIVITGEGRLDHQTLWGKVPFGIAKMAKRYHKPVIAVGGSIEMDIDNIHSYIDAIFSIQTKCWTLEEAMSEKIATKQLEITAQQIARLIQVLK